MHKCNAVNLAINTIEKILTAKNPDDIITVYNCL